MSYKERLLLEAKRGWLIPYLQGWGWKLDACIYGKRIHLKPPLRQKIIHWMELLQSPHLTLKQMDRIEALAPIAVSKARRLWLDHVGIVDAERELRAIRDMGE